MEIKQINNALLVQLHNKAKESERLRQNFDLRTTAEDGSQRMLNALEVGTKVPIHRHTKSSETVVCLEGCFDEVRAILRAERLKRRRQIGLIGFARDLIRSVPDADKNL